MNKMEIQEGGSRIDAAELEILAGLGIRNGNKRYATRVQIEKLFNVPRKTLANNIERLKIDGLLNGAKIRHVAGDGKKRLIEVYTIDEVIAIGFRLRSDLAIKLQRYASNLMVERIDSMIKEKRLLELELSYAWNKSDVDDLYIRNK